MSASLAPAIPFIAGGLALPLIRERARNMLLLVLAALAFVCVYQLEPGMAWHVPFMGLDLVPLKVDKLSKVFGYVFTLNAFAAFLFAYKLDDLRQHLAALFYIGASVGAVFAGDLVSLYVCWEVMAIASVFLVLARDTTAAYQAGYRYILVHLFGGLALLIGIVLHVYQTGSIAFDPFQARTPAAWLILCGVLVNASAFPFSSWLSDAYPESTVTGGVILSAYTTKTAVYALLRGFAGWEVLIWVGGIMVIYGVIYGLLENDMRRILAYSITNKVGFMITGAGIGTPLAVNGATAHAFCSVIYTALLWMSTGAVLAMTGRSKCTELGGLWKSMPWTMAFGVIGALTISSLPITCGFTSKTLIIEAAAGAHLVWAWLPLEIASAGVFLYAGLKLPFFVFFNGDRGLKPPEAPRHMLLAMGLLAFLCIYLGLFPGVLYGILPFTFEPGFTVYSGGIVLGQLQLLMFSALAFFVFLSLLKRTDTITLEVDWFYRKGGRLFYAACDRALNGLNAAAERIGGSAVGRLMAATRTLPERGAVLLATPFLAFAGRNTAVQVKAALREAVASGQTGAGPTILAVLFALALAMAMVM